MIKRIFLFAMTSIAMGVALIGAEAREGVLDLREVNLFEDQLRLDGYWGFYWGKLLAPEELADHPAQDYYYFPEIWNGHQSVRGLKLSRSGAATYTLRLLMPDQYPKLALYIKHVYTAGDIYINDELVDFGGVPEVNAEATKPKWVPKIIDLPSNQDTINIVLHISNFSHQKGGAREPIVLASKDVLEDQRNELMAFDFLLAGTLIMTGLFFLGLYFFGMKTNAALFFALFCLSFSYRMVGADDYTLQTIYQGMSWLLAIKLEYIFLFVPPLFFSLYTHALYPMEYKVNPFYVFALISGLFATVTLVCPPSIFTWLVAPYLTVLLLGIVVGVITYVRAYQRNMNGSKWALMSSLVIFAVFGYEIFIYVGALEQVEVLSFTGYILFFFCQSIILFLLFTDSLKKAKEEAEQASKTKSEFLSMMSHEIRTPMNAVIGLTNYMIEDAPKESQLETLSTLKFSAENLLVIINDILDFSKIEAKKVELDYHPTNVHELTSRLQQIFLPMAQKKGVEIFVHIDSEIPNMILCDQTRMSQVLTNLIGNAIKFTEKGRVDVSLRHEGKTNDDLNIRFEVEDTGIGINEDRQKMIFESFTQANSSITREFGGTGLGLAITKRLLELQDVELNLKSEEGKGSLFWFVQSFRVVEEKPMLQSTEVNGERKQLKAAILLVEDNYVNVLVARKFLDKWGATVVVARNGEEAIAMVKDRTYDLILMDLQMPLMDGFTASRRIRATGVNTPIIALTASVLVDDRAKIYEAGMNDFVTKPFDPDQLFYKILHLT